ncbi:MAG TPA: hypothetical protein VL281_06265 [Mycobacteriales bacterium]|nr:hypothetical protein [Mycobacteriales bacterium]
MTTFSQPVGATRVAHRVTRLPLRQADVLLAQLTGIAALLHHRQAMDGELARGSREQDRDHRLREEVVLRQLEAAVERTRVRMAEAGDAPMDLEVPARALVAHSRRWVVDRAAECFEALGFEVVGRTDNGADAVGIAAAEQPDVALLGDTLVMERCEEVVWDIRAVSPATLIGVHGSDPLHLAELLDQGADLMFAAGVPPETMAQDLVGAL